MNSRERVLKAVNFEQPDRVPIDLGGMRASGINAVVYDRLKERIGIHTPTKIHDTMQILAEIELPVLNHFGADIIPLDAGDAEWAGSAPEEGTRKKLFCGQDVYFNPEVCIRENDDESWDLLDNDSNAYAHLPKDGLYFDFINLPNTGPKIDPKSFNPADTVTEEQLEVMARRGRYLYTNTDKAILGWGASITLIGLSALLGPNITQGKLADWLYLLTSEKETAHELMDRYVEATIKRIKLFHEAAGAYCFAWGVGSDDAGTQRGEFISPDLFREMITPHYKKLCGWVHTNTSWKTFLHSCGSINNFIPEWIDAGIDILNPVQISAANMEPELLVRDFGGKVVFWGGGCDTQRILPLGTVEEVTEHVRHNLTTFCRDSGGYVFSQVHNIQQNVPVENVEAMLIAAGSFKQPR